MKTELILTADGSHTLLLKKKNESYHSRYGALQESKHIFINNGLHYCTKKNKNLNILDVGFGTGLNALLSIQYSLRNKISIEYTAIEPFPIGEDVFYILNYPLLKDMSDVKDFFIPLHRAPIGYFNIIAPSFKFMMIHEKLEKIRLQKINFDLVYYDAFAPAIQPELWETGVFRQIVHAMKPGGILVTYCCKGDVKRAMQTAGLITEKIPGPAGKREFLRARKP